MPHNISSTRQVPESHWLEVTARVGWPLLRFFSGLTHSTSCSIFGQVTWDTADFNWHFWISIFQFRGVCWIRGSVIGVNILDQSPVSKSLVCLFTVGIRILFEESHDGKREMAAEISQPVTLTSIFSCTGLSRNAPPQERCVATTKTGCERHYNPGQTSWDTNATARQIEASSLPLSLPVQCWGYAFKF